MKQSSKWIQFKLPLIILASFLFAAAWMLAGRLLFGVFGWMFLILLFTVVPIIVIYGGVLTVIVAVRQRKYMFRKSGPFIRSLVITLVTLLVSGTFMPDGGDTKESGASALSTILMDRNNTDLIALSGAISGWTLFIAFLAAIVTFIFALSERPKRNAPMPEVLPKDHQA